MTISSWILSIAGVSLLSVLIDLFLPEGSINGYIKTVFNFAIILVIVTPVPSLLHKEFDTSLMFSNQEIVINNEYIYQLNRDKLTMLEQGIETKLEKEGLLNIDISISADIFTTQMLIESIYVDLSNLVISNNDKHINIENEIIEVISPVTSPLFNTSKYRVTESDGLVNPTL